MSLSQGGWAFASAASDRTFAVILAGHPRATKPNFIFNLYSSSGQIIQCHNFLLLLFREHSAIQSPETGAPWSSHSPISGWMVEPFLQNSSK